MNGKTVILFLLATSGLGSCELNFGKWLKLMNNKTRSASEDLNRFIDKAKVGVGEHLIGNNDNLGRPVSVQRVDGQMTLDGDDNDSENVGDKAEEINLFDEKRIDITREKRIVNELDEGGTSSGFGSLDSEDGLFMGSDDDSDEEVLFRTSVNESLLHEEDSVIMGEQNLMASNQSSSSTFPLTTPTIIGISSAGCVCVLIIVTLSILAISSKKKQFENQENVSNTEDNQYDRGYGEDVGYDNGGTDGGFYQRGRSDYYPVI